MSKVRIKRDDWTLDRLSDLVEIYVSNVDKKSYENEKSVSLCNYMDVYSNEYITSNLDFMQATASQSQISKFGVKKGDVMITKDSETPDDIGIAAVAIEDIDNLVCGYHLALLKPKTDKIDGIFLSKQLSTYKVNRHFANKANGSTRYGLTLNVLETALIPYPTSLATQRYIAKILTTCDKVIEQTEAAITKYKAIKQGMLHDLFTRGLDENGKLRSAPSEAPDLYKESELGLIPKDWEVKKLENIAVISSGIDYKKNPKGDTVPIYGTGGIMGYTSISLNQGPAVLSGRKGSINKPYYIDGEFWNVDTIFCIKTIANNNAKWLYYVIEQIDMMKYNEATGVPSITSKTLNRISLSTPLPQEQKDIINRIMPLEMKLQGEENALDKYKAIKKGIMLGLLTIK